MERLTVPDKKIDGGLRRAIIDAREVRKEAMTIYWALKKYEDTGLTPEQIMELKEAVQKLENIFGDEITVNQVIDFFVDFYIAQGDPDRVEKAELLTNEEAAKWRGAERAGYGERANKRLGFWSEVYGRLYLSELRKTFYGNWNCRVLLSLWTTTEMGEVI